MKKRLAAILVLASAPLFAADDEVMRAMRDEIARSMKKLQLENLDKPFFVAYRVMEPLRCNISASFGALIYDGDCETAGSPRNRGVTVEVRVGDYTRDNTNFWRP
jgi:TldD protein